METQILEVLNTTLEELSAKVRNENIIMKRHLFCAALRYKNVKLKDIAARINRTHSTVCNSLNKVSILTSNSDKLIMSDYLRLQEMNLINGTNEEI